MAADALGYPLGFILTGANVSDFDQAKPLIRKYSKPNVYAIMDKGYDSDVIRNCVQEQGGTATRYEKTLKHFNAMLPLASISICLKS